MEETKTKNLSVPYFDKEEGKNNERKKEREKEAIKLINKYHSQTCRSHRSSMETYN